MRTPKLKPLPQERRTIDSFYGYDHRERIREGSFYDEENLTSEHFPVPAVRKPRQQVALSERVQGLAWLDGLWAAMGTGLVQVSTGRFFGLGLSEGQKTLIPFGARLLVLPDEVYLNTAEPLDCGPMGKTVEAEGDAMIEVDLVDEAFNFLPLVYILDSPPQRPVEGSFWLDTSLTPPVLKRLEDGWVETQCNLRLEFHCRELALQTVFDPGDRVGLTAVHPIVEGTVRRAEGNVLIVSGVQTVEHREIETADGFVLRSRLPKLDFLFEQNNRLWGCRYGLNHEGDFVNEIRASKPGDADSWNCFAGLSTDSYVLSCGTDGPWTGAMEVRGYPTFWKEHCLHQVYGGYPAQYSCAPMACSGVAPGSSGTMAVVDGVLYYNSDFGICRFDGSLPKPISEALGTQSLRGGQAGALGRCYYAEFAEGLFVYDTAHRLWHRQSCTGAERFVCGGGKLYYLCDGAIWQTEGEGAEVSWFAETGLIGEDHPMQKRLVRIDLRLALAAGARLRVFVQYDSGGSWEPLAGQLTGTSLRVFSLPLRPRRCDHLRLRLEGEGEARLFALTLITEKGSDRI